MVELTDVLNWFYEFCRKLEETYEGKLDGVFLFGSWIMGTATEESDIDICVVTNEEPDLTTRKPWKPQISRETILNDLKEVLEAAPSKIDLHVTQWFKFKTLSHLAYIDIILFSEKYILSERMQKLIDLVKSKPIKRIELPIVKPARILYDFET